MVKVVPAVKLLFIVAVNTRLPLPSKVPAEALTEPPPLKISDVPASPPKVWESELRELRVAWIFALLKVAPPVIVRPLLLNCPAFPAKNSTVPVMVPGPLPANPPVPPIPILPVTVELLKFRLWPPFPSYRAAKFAASPSVKPACACGIPRAVTIANARTAELTRPDGHALIRRFAARVARAPRLILGRVIKSQFLLGMSFAVIK